MTEITDLNPVDESNTSLTGNGITGGNFVSNFDNAMRGLLGLLGRLNSGAAPISDLFTIADPADLTKQARFDTGLITPGQRRVITLPDQDITLGTGTAAGTTFTPAGNIAATDVQAAIQELDTEKQPLDSDLTSWAGVTRASGFDTFVATPSSANLKALLTDETGSGAAVFADTPTLVTPILGAATGTSIVLSGQASASAFVPTANTVPTNGMYLPAANNLGWAINGSAELVLTSGRLGPTTNAGLDLGSATLSFDDFFLGSGSIINFANGNFTLTHSSGVLTASGNIAVADDAYAAGWNGSANVPTKNAVYDKIELILGTTLPATYQPLLATLTSWGAVTRAAGFDTFTATPSSANLRSLLTDEDGTGPALFGGSSYIREKLTADRTYYVRTDGSDSNTGLVNNAGGAFLTLQKAFDTMATLDGNGYSVTIQQGTAGTLTGSFNANKYLIGIASVVLDLGGGTLSTTSATAVTIQRPMHITVQNGTLQTTTDGSGIRASGAGVNVTLGSSVTFGACASAHILMRDGAKLTISNAYTISGNAPHHYQIEFSGILEMANFTVTVSGTPAFANSFAFTYMGGIVSAYSVSYSGAATGKRYDVTIGGLINVFGGGVNYFPGNSVGTVSPDAIGYG